MKTYAPQYYPQFRCIADQCKHSCCIGWEIHIDEDTYATYRDMPGELGKRINENIAVCDGDAAFILKEGDRCPFLNERGLCDLIIAGGEELLCNICDKHPRYYHWFLDCKEVGVGLSCEAAAKLIVSEQSPMQLVCVGCDDAEEEVNDIDTEWMFEDRQNILSMLQDRTVDIKQRIQNVCDFCEITDPNLTPEAIKNFCLQLEILDEQWHTHLQNLSADGWTPLSKAPVIAEQLLCYFIYRHYSNGIWEDGYTQYVLFALYSVRMIFAMTETLIGELSIDNIAEIARMYSAEIEYSEENLERMLDMLYASAEK